MSKITVIAIDGPSGAGKSTAARSLAEALGIHCLDTGALFRALAWAMQRQGVDTCDAQAVAAAVDGYVLNVTIEDGVQRTWVNDEDASGYIRNQQVAQGASDIGVVPRVRQVLTEQVRQLAHRMSMVVEGRDIGTAMLPEANHKFFLTATPQERANRRQRELQASGQRINYDTVLQQIILRDQNDSNRPIAPLMQAEDAVVIDSTDMNCGAVLERMLTVIGTRQ